MHLRTNKKTLQNLSAAFKVIADGVEQIESNMHGYMPNGISDIKSAITLFMTNIEQQLKRHCLIRQNTHLNYTAHENGYSIHIDVDAASVYRAVVMEWMEDPSQPQKDHPYNPLSDPYQDLPKDSGRWDRIPEYNPAHRSMSDFMPSQNHSRQTTPPHDAVADVKERVVNFKLD